jgi:hypothetical protein
VADAWCFIPRKEKQTLLWREVIEMVVSGPAGTDKPVHLFVKTALFAWSGGDAEQKVDRVGCVIKKVYRARGSTGLAAQPLAGEKELGRFVAQHLHMVAMVGSDGKLVDGPVWSGTFRLACEGGGELLLTDRRLLITVILGETVLGDVNERNGKIFVIDIPYGVITSVDVMRKKAFFGGMKVKAIRVQSITPPTVLDVEPIAQLDSSWVVAAKASY